MSGNTYSKIFMWTGILWIATVPLYLEIGLPESYMIVVSIGVPSLWVILFIYKVLADFFASPVEKKARVLKTYPREKYTRPAALFKLSNGKTRKMNLKYESVSVGDNVIIRYKGWTVRNLLITGDLALINPKTLEPYAKAIEIKTEHTPPSNGLNILMGIFISIVIVTLILYFWFPSITISHFYWVFIGGAILFLFLLPKAMGMEDKSNLKLQTTTATVIKIHDNIDAEITFQFPDKQHFTMSAFKFMQKTVRVGDVVTLVYKRSDLQVYLIQPQ